MTDEKLLEMAKTLKAYCRRKDDNDWDDTNASCVGCVFLKYEEDAPATEQFEPAFHSCLINAVNPCDWEV